MALGPDITLTNGESSKVFRQYTSQGIYIRDDSTVDEPIILTVKSTPKASGESSFLVRLDYSINRASTGVPLPDARCSVYLVQRGDLSVFNTEFRHQARLYLTSFFDDSTRVMRFERGEV